MKSKLLLCAFLAIAALLIFQFSRSANNSNNPEFLTSKSPESSSPNSAQDKSLLDKTKSLFQNGRDVLQKTFDNASESLNNLKENLVSDNTKSQEKKETENSTPNPSEAIPNQENPEKSENNPPLNENPTTDTKESPSDLEKTPKTAEIPQEKTEESQSWLDTLKDKTGSVYEGVKNKTESIYEGVKDKALPTLSDISTGAQEKASQIGGAAKEKFSEALDQVTPEIPVPVSFLIKHWNLIYWVLVVLAVCFVLKVILLVLSCIQSTASLLKAPKEFLTHPFIKWLPVKIKEYVQKLAERSQDAKIGKDKRDSQRSFTDEESGRIMDESQENEENSYCYYKCSKCEEEWETVILGKSQVQECENKECLERNSPYKQIKLLSNKQKQEEIDKIKVH